MASVTSVGTLVEGLRKGDRRAVARLISLVEDGAPEASEAIREVYPLTGHASTIGLTGAPGAGKSTLIDGLVVRARAEDKSVGVIACDPTSPFSGGALLGDRVRMQEHALDEKVFIRSMATRGHLGGLSLAAPEAMRVLEAAGSDVVIVETVGVGQSEVEVAKQADTTIVVLAPGMGDAIQAAKAGVLEIADIFCVNKSDKDGANETARDVRGMLELGHGRDPEWDVPIVLTSAATDQGIDELWAAIRAHEAHLRKGDRLAAAPPRALRRGDPRDRRRASEGGARGGRRAGRPRGADRRRPRAAARPVLGGRAAARAVRSVRTLKAVRRRTCRVPSRRSRRRLSSLVRKPRPRAAVASPDVAPRAGRRRRGGHRRDDDRSRRRGHRRAEGATSVDRSDGRSTSSGTSRSNVGDTLSFHAGWTGAMMSTQFEARARTSASGCCCRVATAHSGPPVATSGPRATARGGRAAAAAARARSPAPARVRRFRRPACRAARRARRASRGSVTAPATR